MSKVIYLTKSRYVAGLQCLRRLWLNVHEPLERQEPEPGTALDVGIEVGRRMTRRYPTPHEPPMRCHFHAPFDLLPRFVRSPDGHEADVVAVEDRRGRPGRRGRRRRCSSDDRQSQHLVLQSRDTAQLCAAAQAGAGSQQSRDSAGAWPCPRRRQFDQRDGLEPRYGTRLRLLGSERRQGLDV